MDHSRETHVRRGQKQIYNAKAGDHAIDVTTGFLIGRMLFGDAVHSPALRIDLLGLDLEPELLLQCPGDGTAHRVRLPL